MSVTAQDGVEHRLARRQSNEQKASAKTTASDAQGLVEFGCECIVGDCDRSVRVPLYVYRRILEARDQYLVQAAHHAFPRYRTIVTSGLMRIEERA